MKHKNLYRLSLVLILAVTVLIYGRSLDYGTVNWDDALSRKAQQRYTRLDLQELVRILTPNSRATYQPVRELTSTLLARVSGPDTWWPYHLVSLALYLGTVLLFYVIVRLLRGRGRLPGGPEAGEWGALLAAAFFAFHPGHVEVTAWVLGQKDALAGFFYLGSFYFYMRSPETGRRELVFSLVLYALALGSKPSAVGLALVPPLYDRIFRPALFKPGCRSKLIAVYSLYFLPALAGAFYFIFTTARVGAVAGLEAPLTQTGKIAGALSFSAVKLLLPVNLCLRYPGFGFAESIDLRFFLYLLAALLILFWVIFSYHEKKPYAFFACWALVALLPNLNLVPIRIERADRYYYLASMGFSGLAGYAGIYLYGAAGGRLRALIRPLMLLVLVCLAALSYRQVGFWSDGPAAWRRTLSIYPDLILARVSLGHSYLRLGENKLALETYRPLLEVGRPNIEALKGAARIMVDKGDEPAAIRLLELGKRLAPGDYELVEMLARLFVWRNELEPARELAAGWAGAEPENQEAQLLLAELCVRLGRRLEAAEIYSRYDMRLLDLSGLEFMGAHYHEQGALEQALECFLEMTRRQPRLARGYNNAGVVCEQMGRYAAADSLYLKAVELDSAYIDAFFNRGNLMRLTGNPAAAISCYLRADSLAGGRDRAVIEALGNAFRDLGDQASAERCFRRLKALEPAQP